MTTPPTSIWRKMRQLFQSRHPDAPETTYRVLNVTRDVEIATCAEVATSTAKRSKGLLGRTEFLPGEALWIVPCESVHTFGMKFAIDLVYLDRHLRIRKIRRNVPPWRISVCLTAHSVVELPAGTIHPRNAEVGEVVEFLPARKNERQNTPNKTAADKAGPESTSQRVQARAPQTTRGQKPGKST
ncbi:MAG TPA: DUF192 domain-containing protein [Terracidiphilus sp.]|nr:DUF192 domain-containing protein [Terracidiphilus sp.]